MNKCVQARKFLSLFLLVSVLVVLPACSPGSWFKNKLECEHCGDHSHGKTLSDVPSSSSCPPDVAQAAVITFAGQPKTTGAELEKSIQLLMTMQPAFKEMMPFMGEEQQDQIFEQIAETILAENLAREFLHRNGIDQTPEFRENARQVHEAVDRDLTMRALETEILKLVDISDDQAERFYQENKERLPILQRPPFVVTPGGVRAETITVSTEQQAKELADQARKENLADVAKRANTAVSDLGLVHAQSLSVDPEIKSQILSLTNFPDVVVVKNETNNQWNVVKASGKENANHADFNQIKDVLKQQVMMRDEFTKHYTNTLAQLKEEFKVAIDKEALRKLRQCLIPARSQDIAGESNEMGAEDRDVSVEGFSDSLTQAM